MKQSKEELNYQQKLKSYSDGTIRLILRCNGTKENRAAKHQAVMESKTEEELVQKLEALLKSSPN